MRACEMSDLYVLHRDGNPVQEPLGVLEVRVVPNRVAQALGRSARVRPLSLSVNCLVGSLRSEPNQASATTSLSAFDVAKCASASRKSDSRRRVPRGAPRGKDRMGPLRRPRRRRTSGSCSSRPSESSRGHLSSDRVAPVVAISVDLPLSVDALHTTCCRRTATAWALCGWRRASVRRSAPRRSTAVALAQNAPSTLTRVQRSARREMMGATLVSESWNTEKYDRPQRSLAAAMSSHIDSTVPIQI